MRTFLNISTGPKEVGRCPHVHNTPAAAGQCAEDRLHHAREVTGTPQFDARLTVVAADPDTGLGTTTLELDEDEQSQAREAREAQQRMRASEGIHILG